MGDRDLADLWCDARTWTVSILGFLADDWMPGF